MIQTEFIAAIDDLPITELIAAYGSPLMVFSEARLVARIREAAATFRQFHPAARLAWSVKTNSLDGILRIFRREGCMLEVVSEQELARAEALAVPGEDIVYNGPWKTDDSLVRALRNGVLVNIDHESELWRFEQLARAAAVRPSRVGLRINIQTDHAPHWSRFGFSLENGEALAAVRAIGASDVLALRGLHFHLGTYLDNPHVYGQAAAKVADFITQVADVTQLPLDYIDVGGGVASANRLKHEPEMPSAAGQVALGPFAAAIGEHLNAATSRHLLVELGRTLIDDSGFMLATVRGTMSKPGGGRALIIDGGVNVLFTALGFRHPVAPVTQRAGAWAPTSIHGPLCMDVDTLMERRPFPPLECGDHLVIGRVGAYNTSMWMQFIAPRPAVVLVGAERSHALLRRAEVLEDLTSLERTPPWLS